MTKPIVADAPARFATRFNAKDRILEVACGTHVAATFDVTEGTLAEAEAHRLNYVEAERYAPETLIDEGLRLAAEDEPGWSYWLPSGRVVWVTDEPARMTPQQRYAEAQWLFAAQGPEVAK